MECKMRSKLLWTAVLVFVLLFFACTKNNNEENDSDKIANDSENVADSVTNDEEGQDDQKNDETSDRSGSDKETSDSDSSNICDPNPCDTEENRKTFKTRCMPENEGTSYTCLCDTEHHESDGICCQSYSNNVGGKCECNTYYVEPVEAPDTCVAECTENTIEGFNGYCEPGKVCQQGICIDDKCDGYTCPENSTCSVKNDAAFCQCNEGLTMSDGKCCPVNSTNKSGTCECDEGYEKSGDECVAKANNKCVPNPCEDSGQPLHKNVCVQDSSSEGYHCECNENYEADGDGCDLVEYEVCPTGLQCLAGYCVPFDLSNEQCLTTDDCREFPGATSTCASPHAAGGICIGCTVASDCPGNSQCYDTYGTCALLCDDDGDCPYGDCKGTGYCGQKTCYSNEDCFGGSLCIDSNGSGSGMCQRIPCKETACSATNPGGTCEAGKACIGGTCVGSCDPNPCVEVNRGTCEIKLGVPSCLCEEGTHEVDGKCTPDTVTTCPSSFSCVGSYCVNSSDIGFVCGNDADCEDADLTCSPTLPSGTCNGCTYNAECPHGGAEFSDCVSGYCLRKCLLDTDCNSGMSCLGSGYCGKKSCTSPKECPEGYTCSESGKCSRIPCS